MKNGNFFHNAVNVVNKLLFVKNFNGNFVRGIMFVVGHENFSKSSGSKNLSFAVDHVVLLKLVNSLLHATSVDRNFSFGHCFRQFFAAIRLGRVQAPHVKLIYLFLIKKNINHEIDKYNFAIKRINSNLFARGRCELN